MNLEPYRTRRGLLMEQLAKGVVLIRGAGSEGGLNPSFFYLTGINDPRAVLLMAPGGMRVGTGRMHPGPNYVRGQMVQQVLFLPSRDPMAAQWGEGSAVNTSTVTAEEAGVEAIFSTAEMSSVLGPVLAAAARLYYMRGYASSVGGDDDPDTEFTHRLSRRFLNLEVCDATSNVHEMRRVKDADEVAAIEKSVGVVAQAIDRVMQIVRPGMLESELEAEIIRIYRIHGGEHAFEPIVGSGPNALVLHYTANSGPIEAGQMLLIDTGVSIGGYKADITRTIPVDGTFTVRQRELYEVVLAAQDAVVADCKPGALIGDLHARAWESIDAAGHSEHFIHGIGHHLGLETHDVGDLYRPLAEGCVITVEPGVYRSDDGIGIRIEDDVLIDADGPRVLGPGIPKTVEAIEARMAARGE